ncbi:MAG: Fe-S cluster assembly protein SufD [Actinomycetes bacterium]
MSLLTSNYLTPTGREEAWRFTPLHRLGGLLDHDVSVVEGENLVATGEPVSGVSYSIIAADGFESGYIPTDQVVLRGREVTSQISLLTIAKECEVQNPIYLQRQGGEGLPSFSRLVISLETHARATVVIENSGSAIVAEEIEIRLAAGANLTFISLQEWERDAVHMAGHHAIIGKDAAFTSFEISVGGSLVRLLPTVEYSGPGSTAQLNGLYFATNGQHLENRIHVDHNIAQAKSRVNYKGALAGANARSVWIGDVFIRAAAEGTDTYELNRNLLLSDGARADSVPNLEIETGEIVGAGHASTTGRFDDEQLFYLQSRGIPAEVARKLVIRGYFSEIINLIGISTIADRLMARIDSELEKVGE